MSMSQEELQKLLDEFGQSEIAQTPQWKIDQIDALVNNNKTNYIKNAKGGKNAVNKMNSKNRKSGHWNKWSKVNGQRAFDKTAVSFYQCDMDGNIIKEWKGIKECARELGLTWQHISAVLQGRRKSHKGFIWKYKE